MGGSPFHGIFSAFGQTSKRETTSADNSAPQDAGHGKLAVDIYEQDDYTIIRAPIAGVRMSDIDIEVNDNVLTIRGTRRVTDSVPQDQYYLQECFWGSFSRNVTLPNAIDSKKIRATFGKDCVLKILIPREEKVKIVKISEA
jgi:HSP20 family protein